jgi:hypothetical protein
MQRISQHKCPTLKLLTRDRGCTDDLAREQQPHGGD